MNTQNILRFYGSKLDISLDSSEFYDFKLDTNKLVDLTLDVSELYDFKLDTLVDRMDIVDLKLDYSEYYDFELVNVYDYQTNYVNGDEMIISVKVEDNYYILSKDGFVLMTENNEKIQFQF
jgi:hypothetical protein